MDIGCLGAGPPQLCRAWFVRLRYFHKPLLIPSCRVVFWLYSWACLVLPRSYCAGKELDSFMIILFCTCLSRHANGPKPEGYDSWEQKQLPEPGSKRIKKSGLRALRGKRLQITGFWSGKSSDPAWTEERIKTRIPLTGRKSILKSYLKYLLFYFIVLIFVYVLILYDSVLVLNFLLWRFALLLYYEV